MKKVIYCSAIILGVILFTSFNTFGQAGNFNVLNRTDCDVEVSLRHASGGVCGAPTGCSQKIPNLIAYANSTTMIHSGAGITLWSDIEITKVVDDNCGEYDGDCNGTGAPFACDCDGTDIKVVWDNCVYAYIGPE